MAIFGVLNGILGLETSAWTKGCDKAGADIDKLHGKSEGFLKGLKGFRETGLGQSFEVAVGGGALRVFDEIGKRIKETAEKITSVRDAWEAGNASAGDMVETVIKGIPVVGSFWDAGRAVREMFTGEAAEAKKVTEELQAQASAIRIRTDLLRDAANIAHKASEEIAAMAAKNILGEMPEGTPKKIGQTINDYNSSIQKLNDDYFEGRKRINEKLAGSDFAKEALKNNPNLSASSDWAAILGKQKANLDKEYADAQAAVAEAAKGTLYVGADGMATSRVDDKAFAAAQEKALSLSKESQNLAGILSAASKESGSLSAKFAGEQHQQFIGAADGIKHALTDAFTKPIDAGLKGFEDWNKKSSEWVKKNLDNIDQTIKGMNEAGRTPLQKYLEEKKKLDFANATGKLNASAYGVLSKDYLKGYDEEVKSQMKSDHLIAEYHPAPLVQHTGSAGINIGLPTIANPLESLNKTAKEQLAEQKKQTGLTEQQVKAANSGYIVMPL